ncbi:4-carboxy-2-hydroxymuconate-6-semialdehyde dehydrogenase [Posidoniimonas polymericola]|uniref:4-carboxy-2-hydroxymuconate-6-semialdehyde dehydrogenase n=1 Tax=Posidoniimonas polymericola TaxID=2528002 RepID=A0A5C5XWI4_9BACT|nr:Gfo/Idh/MocA family oxidoreductase [Posidoniimonas polymericola]TWT67707.1 4-carboxy-2-hydroxymuconate-6-semialdehyde dehydrogenase [Posidoniimonas polymericola]
MPHESVNRRGFLATTAAGAALAAAPAVAASGANANNRLRLGFIGVGGRAQTHINSALALQKEENLVEIATICDVFNRYRDTTAKHVETESGKRPKTTGDYQEILADDSIDAVVISTPDHWHAKQTIDALNAGKHVYCEKPMTHSVEEALAVHQAWKDSGQVMQVGVQSTSLPVWEKINERICSGDLGKVMQYQTEFFRNSDMGQWRYYNLAQDMTPDNIDWEMFLGTKYGLAPEMPFDRAKFAQWRCYWDFGSGMFTDLFVHRTTSMLKATGLRFPGRVTGAGGIYLEYDGRTVPDVATVVADFNEGVQGLVTATMCCGETPIKQLIRGHSGSVVLGVGEEFTGYDFVAERPQVHHERDLKSERVEVGGVNNSSKVHFKNFTTSAIAGDPSAVNCSPELGAAAMTIVKLGSRSYREGKVFHFDQESMTFSDGNSSWAQKWEERSADRGECSHVAGWAAEPADRGSKLFPRPYQKLEGPWIDGKDPAATT